MDNCNHFRYGMSADMFDGWMSDAFSKLRTDPVRIEIYKFTINY